MMRSENHRIENVDVIVICQEPRLLPFFESIRERLSALLGIDGSRIGLKAKTFERLGEIGGGAACACLATVLLAGRD